MQVTRDVVKDLLTVYMAEEASADTRRLVEEWLESDAGLAADLARARGGLLDLPATAAPRPDCEKRALDETRQLLKVRTSTLAVAVLFTILPLSFVFSGGHVTFFLVRDAPVIAAAWWATAAVMWTWHAMIRRRLRVSGL